MTYKQEVIHTRFCSHHPTCYLNEHYGILIGVEFTGSYFLSNLWQMSVSSFGTLANFLYINTISTLHTHSLRVCITCTICSTDIYIYHNISYICINSIYTVCVCLYLLWRFHIFKILCSMCLHNIWYVFTVMIFVKFIDSWFSYSFNKTKILSYGMSFLLFVRYRCVLYKLRLYVLQSGLFQSVISYENYFKFLSFSI